MLIIPFLSQLLVSITSNASYVQSALDSDALLLSVGQPESTSFQAASSTSELIEGLGGLSSSRLSSDGSPALSSLQSATRRQKGVSPTRRLLFELLC